MFSILVVEDDKNLNRMICAKLKQAHYSAFPAFDGQEALEIMEREHIDLVISDVMTLNAFINVMNPIRRRDMGWGCPL